MGWAEDSLGFTVLGASQNFGTNNFAGKSRSMLNVMCAAL